MNLSKVPTTALKKELEKRLKKEGNELYIMKPLFPDPIEDYTQKGGGFFTVVLYLFGVGCFALAVVYFVSHFGIK
ncbi:hypothetical protein [Chondrinema litorale]|uniref:hypothetical protein n=1 Tax=Chondrinema litorale TaxID=2994555 RepID=UPI0025434981|nr:hypothetical protein [Chondrinema litorale]UZS00258.1 hypothetical protein OQ292_40670 [Chondrinema litorale]